jgi:hypothetical protein
VWAEKGAIISMVIKEKHKISGAIGKDFIPLTNKRKVFQTKSRRKPMLFIARAY